MNFSGVENTVFFEPKSWCKYYIHYWKVLVLNFSGMGDTFFFWDKKLMKRWYLLITECSCFELFGEEKYGLFWGKKLMGRWYLLVTEKVLVLSFSVIENAVFSETKRWYLLVTEKFLFWAFKKFLFWAFRWWEIRFFF